MPDLRPFFDAPLAAAQAAVDGSLSDAAGRLSAESDRRAAAEQRAAGLQALLDDLRANPPVGDAILWKPGTVIESGKTYRVLGPVNVRCNVPRVRFVGSMDTPTWPDGGAGIVFGPAALDGTVEWVWWNKPDGPSGAVKVGVKACVVTTGTATAITRCLIGRVDNCVEAMTGADGVHFFRNIGTEDLRGGLFYGAGAKNVYVCGNQAAESQCENLVRFSPDGTNICDGVFVVGNALANDANGDPEKAVIDVRHARRARVIGNSLYSIPQHSCVGIGSHDGVGPGADDVLVYDNDCYGGSITVNGGANNVNVDGNRAHWAARGENSFVGANFKIPQLQALRVANNSGVSPVAQKGMVGFMGDPTGRKFENVNNFWEIKQ